MVSQVTLIELKVSTVVQICDGLNVRSLIRIPAT